MNLRPQARFLKKIETMDEQNKKRKSIWGTWWAPHRTWFYPLWLIYETSSRFYSYSLDVYYYLETQHGAIAPYLSGIGAQTLSVFCSIATFIICTAFLTVPACYLLYKLFKIDNLTATRLEEKMKVIF